MATKKDIAALAERKRLIQVATRLEKSAENGWASLNKIKPSGDKKAALIRAALQDVCWDLGIRIRSI